MRHQRTLALTAAALVGFAANSLLCRAALRGGDVDPATFTFVRLASGAAMLALLVRATRPASARPLAGWRAPLALFVYAIAFSFAYLRLDAGTGALILFGSVQATMLAVGMRGGERPRPNQWLGLAVAFAGLVALTAPGASAPNAAGAALMALAGIAWGAYTLLGRGGGDPLATTARNFALALPFAAAASVVALAQAHANPRGLALACASGALASGLGYSLWYAALRDLTATAAAIVQLSVPVIAAIGSALLLAEPLSARAALCGAVILAGVGCAMARR